MIKQIIGCLKKKKNICIAAVVICIMVIASSSLFDSSRVYALKLKQQSDSTTYYTNDSKEITIELSSELGVYRVAVFSKDEDGNCNVNGIYDGFFRSDFTLEGEWEPFVVNEYYYIITKVEESELLDMEGQPITEEDGIFQVTRGERTLTLQEFAVVYDNKGPVISDTELSPEGWTNDKVTITVTAEDEENGSGLATEAYSFDGGESWQKSNSKSVTENGDVEICVQDLLGNISEKKTVTVSTLDREAPSIASVSQTTYPEGTYEEYTSITLTVSAADAQSGLSEQAYSFDGGETWQESDSYTVKQNGTYKVRVKDIAGNISSYENIEINNIDRPAVITIDNSSIEEKWTGEAKAFYFTVTDTGTGVTENKITGDAGDNGTVTISKTEGDENKYMATVDCSKGTVLDCKVTIRVIDNSDHESVKVTEKNIRIDKEYPKIINTAVENSSQQNSTKYADIYFEVTDSVSGVDEQYLLEIENLEKILVPSSSEAYVDSICRFGNGYMVRLAVEEGKIFSGYATLHAFDNAGNEAADKFSNIMIDDSYAQVTINEDTITESFSAQDRSFTFNLTNTGCGISEVTGSVEGGTVSISNVEGNMYKAVVHTESYLNSKVTLTVRKENNNVTTVSTEKRFMIDKTAPVITINQSDIKTDWVKDQMTVEFSVADTGSLFDNSKILCSVDGAEITIEETSREEDAYNSFVTYIATIKAATGKDATGYFTVKATDKVGNASEVESEQVLLIDGGVPTISIAEDSIDTNWNKMTTSFEFSISDTGSGVDINDIQVSVQDGTVSFAESEDKKGLYKATVSIAEGEVLNSPISITVKDVVTHTNEVQSKKNIMLDYQSPVLGQLTVTNTTTNHKYAQNGDVIKVQFALSDNQGSGINTANTIVKLNGTDGVKAKLGTDGLYFCEYTVDEKLCKDDDAKFVINSIRFEDMMGNVVEDKQEETVDILYYKPIGESVTKLIFRSENEDSSVVKDGEKIYLSFYSSHPLLLKDGKMGQQKLVSIEWTSKGEKSDTGYYYEGWYKASNDKSYDNMPIQLQLELSDAAGNSSMQVKNDDNKKVTYYAPIEDVFSEFKAVSSNKSNSSYAKNGDTVTITFKTTHPVSVSDASFGSNKLKFSSADQMSWTAVYTIKKGVYEDNTDLQFAFTLSDKAGNSPLSKSQKNIKKIRYQAPIVVNDLSMVSNNTASNDLACDGNTITLTFSVTHPVELSDVKIGGTKVKVSSKDNMNYQAVYKVGNGSLSDLQTVGLLFSVSDKAGNPSKTYKESNCTTNPITYYEPIKVSDLGITTSNSADSTQYAKDGDTVTIQFTTNHECSISSAVIAGKAAEVSSLDTSSNAKKWTVKYKLENGDVSDLSKVGFSFTVNDKAENTPVTKNDSSSDVLNKITYYAPLTSKTAISSSYKNKEYVKNGDTVTLSVQANHNAAVKSASIDGNTASYSSTKGQTLSISYQFGKNDKKSSEGEVYYNYELTDDAGNVILVSSSDKENTGKVIYDRTAPTIKITPANLSVSAKTVTYKVVVTDAHLSGSDFSILVNDKEYLTSSDMSNVSGTTYTKEVTVDMDGSYKIVATIKDMSGNKSNPDATTNLILDTTNPSVKAINLNLDQPTTYKAGLVLSDYFSIEDDNISEVICTVTDKDGVHDWDIATPITAEGKNSVYLLVKDIAGNTSTAITYDFYIDATAPTIKVLNSVEGNYLEKGDKENEILSAMTLKINLEDLLISDGEQPDTFTELKVVDKNGNEVVDLLKDITPDEDGTYTYTFEDYGEYRLIVAAIDSVGNETGELTYNIMFKDKTLLIKFVENKPLFIITVTLAILVIIAAVTMLVMAIRKRKVTQEE